MNIRNYLLVFFLSILIMPAVSQTIVEPSPIAWYTIEEADSLFKVTPKPIFIDVYTDWCGWCKHMMKTTFANKGIASYINQNFYPVKFNAEGFDTVFYNNKTYINKGTNKGSKHEFAHFILNGKFSFPTIVYIDKRKNIFPIPGYLKVKEIEPILVYFVEEINYNIQYNEWETLYQFNYSENYKEEIEKKSTSQYPDTSGKVTWFNFKEASEKSLKSQKPIFVYFYTDWCISCKIIEGTVFRNSVLAEIINNNYYPVLFNAADQNTQVLYGQEFGGSGINQPHKLTYALLKQNFKFPAFVFINEKKQKMDEVHGFLAPSHLESIFTYYSGNTYISTKFNEFLKTFKSKIK